MQPKPRLEGQATLCFQSASNYLGTTQYGERRSNFPEVDKFISVPLEYEQKENFSDSYL